MNTATVHPMTRPLPFNYYAGCFEDRADRETVLARLRSINPRTDAIAEDSGPATAPLAVEYRERFGASEFRIYSAAAGRYFHPLDSTAEAWRGEQGAIAFGEFAEVIAADFVRRLREMLTPTDWAEMRALNATPDYSSACASHNYCDANMPMADAFERATGRALDAGSDADAGLWNAAWDFARVTALADPAPRDLDQRVRDWCAQYGARLDGDVFGIMFSHLSEAEGATIPEYDFQQIMRNACQLYGLYRFTAPTP